MKIAVILLALAAIAELVWIYILNGAVSGIYDRLIEVGKEDKEFWREAQKEISKVHSYSEENAADIRKLRRRLREVGEGTKNLENDLQTFLVRQDKKLSLFREEIEELKKKQTEFDELSEESVRAQIESERAWAEGVRAIAGFGGSIPTLNTKELENE